MAFCNGSAGGGAAGALDDLGGSLGLYEGLSHPAPAGCVCGPAHLRLRSEHGELVKPRGKAVNRCAHCAQLAASENCEMLSLDATQGDAPTGLMVLGTRTPFATIPGECLCGDLDGARCERCSLLRGQMTPYHRGLEKVKRALKRRWPAFEYAALLEFTTGYGERSGGLRRPHWNLLTKGIPVDQLDAAGAIAFPVWCRHVDAEVQAQDVRPIYAAGGLMGYLALHFQKESQQPPEGFTGQRFNCSRGYFTGCSRATARARAREAQALKRETWRQIRRDDIDAPTNVHDIELNAQLAYRVSIATRWVLASASGARLSDQALPTTTPRERGARHAAERSAAKAAALDPDWMPTREVLFCDDARS